LDGVASSAGVVTSATLIMVVVFSAFAGLSLIDLASQARLRLGPWPVAANGRCGVARKLWAMAHAAREVQGMAEGPGAGAWGRLCP